MRRVIVKHHCCSLLAKWVYVSEKVVYIFKIGLLADCILELLPFVANTSNDRYRLSSVLVELDVDELVLGHPCLRKFLP